MNLPLYDVLKTRAEEGSARFHMPGHKGKPILGELLAGACAIDFTELYGTGNLYDGVWPIADAEQLCARAWNVPQAFFLTGGATMGIFSMLFLARSRGEKILVDRGAHRSVYNAVGMLGFDVSFILPEYIEPFGVARGYRASDIEKALDDNKDVSSLILTCPTYYGVCSEISEIAELCKARGILLLVDEAHGAHFPFAGKQSAVAAGADLAVCSAHKTLPALGQAALLLSNGDFSAEEIRRATAIFGTSSPSYQVMASIDLARDFMEREGRAICSELACELQKMRAEINKRGVFRALEIQNMDPLRFCVMTSGAGLSGYKAAQILEEKHKIVCEMADERQVLFIITPADTVQDLRDLNRALISLESERGDDNFSAAKMPPVPKRALCARDVFSKKCESIQLGVSCGRIAANNICPYPPGIPAVAVGEVIDKACIEYLYHNGFEKEDYIMVIKEQEEKL